MPENQTNLTPPITGQAPPLVGQARIQLQSIEALFAEPAADPFDPESRYLSGIDEIANQLRWAHLPAPPRIVIALPAEELTLENQAKTRDAMQRYCAYQIESNTFELHSLRIEARRGMALSILYAVLFIVVGILIGMIPIIPDAIKVMVASLMGIFCWAALWPAADLYLFGWKPFRRARRLYENLRQAELVFESI